MGIYVRAHIFTCMCIHTKSPLFFLYAGSHTNAHADPYTRAHTQTEADACVCMYTDTDGHAHENIQLHTYI